MNGSDYIKNKKDGAKKLVSSRRFKYGSSAVAFTAIFIVFVLLINVLVSVIASKTGGLYIDMTSKKIRSDGGFKKGSCGRYTAR